MPFEEWSGDCMKRLYMRLQQAGVLTEITPTQACDSCKKGDCESKKGVYLQLTPNEVRSGKSIVEIEKDRKEALKATWKREQK